MADEPRTKEALLARIDERWAALQELLGRLDEEQMEQALGDGWSAKVHLAHLAAWEVSLMAILQGKSRAGEMGVPRDVWEGHDTDAINRVVAERSVAQPLLQVIEDSNATHARLFELLGSMTQEDLEKPYSHYQPNDPPENTAMVAGWVHGNTWDHYDEHIGWLEQGLSER